MTGKQKKVFIRIIVSAFLVIALRTTPVENAALKSALYLIPYFIIGYDILKKAFKGIVRKQVFDENFLMAAATLGALLLGEYTEGVAVMLFYQIGELFQSVAVGKSRKSISELMDIRPDYAFVEDENGRLSKISPDEVPVGTVIVVSPGEKIPIDGTVVYGSTSLDTSSLTGESVPRKAQTGDEVISGCISLDGVIKIKTAKEFSESTVSKILELVENASSRKSGSEKFISKFARVYTPAVCGGALLLAVLPPVFLLIAGKDPAFVQWIGRALTFLVISCPCALVISIPLTFFAGIGGAGNAGVLVKGSNFLEALSDASCVVFDKTGTLTEGVFRVNRIVPSENAGLSEQELLRYAAYAESFSSHPISRSIREAYKEKTDPGRVSEVEEISGHGVSALVDGVKVCAGNSRMMSKLSLSVPDPDTSSTTVHVAVDGKYAGYIIISDRLKEGSKEAVEELKTAGIREIVILTGDAKGAAEETAAALSVDKVYSGLLPQDKVEKVEELLAGLSGKEKLVFAGDGINDAPVLTRADIGIAMGALGSDAAIEAADVVLMDDDPRKIVKAVKISKKCMRIVYENIWFAIGVKVLCLLLGALGIAGMWAAVFADVGVMVIAVLNAVRALNVKKL